MTVPALDRETDAIVKTIAQKYRRRCRWRHDVELDDLVQEGYVAAVMARKNFNPEKGKLSHYTSCAVKRAIANYLIISGSPVSDAWHQRYGLLGLKKTSFEGTTDEGKQMPQHNIDHKPGMDEALGYERARFAIMGRLREIFGDEDADILDELLEEQTQDENCPPRKTITAVLRLEIAKERIKDELRMDEFIREWRKAG